MCDMRREAFAEQAMSMTNSLYYVACSLLPVHADREDALQNCMIKGLTRCETLRDDTKFRAWITRILINECHNLLRQKKRVVLIEQLPETEDTAPEHVDIAVRDAVTSLPDKQRVPLILHLEGYTTREIAQALHLPEGTVKTRVRAAKVILRNTLTTREEVLA